MECVGRQLMLEQALKIKLQTICRHLINENHAGILGKDNERSMLMIAISVDCGKRERKAIESVSIVGKNVQIVSFAFFICYSWAVSLFTSSIDFGSVNRLKRR